MIWRTARRLLAGASGVLVLAACSPAATEPSPDTRTAGTSPAASSPSPAPPTTPPGTASGPATPPTPNGSSPNAPSPTTSPTAPAGPPRASTVAEDLDVPWGVVSLPDGSFLVSERESARILRIRDGRAREVAQIRDARPVGEGGLMGMALAPDRRTLFAYYTAADDNRVVAMSWDGAKLGQPRPILTGIPRGWRHDGGVLAIGPDGFLYVGTGEVGEPRLAQDRDSLGGKILRLTLNGKPAPGNPFGTEVWSYGHRNVQGLAFDDAGRLWASEFGERTWDELNLITRGGNYGWPELEGSGNVRGLVNPKVVWPTNQASPSGLAFWRGDLWMGALRGERLWQIPLDGQSAGEPRSHFLNDYGRLRTVLVAHDGGSLLVTTSNTDGRGDPSRSDDRLLRVRS